MSLSKLSTALSGQPFSIKTEWLLFLSRCLCSPPCPLSPHHIFLYPSLLKKLLLSFSKSAVPLSLQQKPRIADYWALMRSTPSLPGSRKHLMLFLFGPENWPGLKETRGGKAEKEMKGGRAGEGRRGKGCRSFSRVCLTALCGAGEEKREVGIEGSRERGREGDGGERREKA